MYECVFVCVLAGVCVGSCSHEWRCPWRPEESFEAFGAGISDDCDTQNLCWELKLLYVQGQHMHLTAELFL